MSTGLYIVVDAINAIGAAAGNVAVGIVADAAAIASATAALSGGAAATGSQTGGQSQSGPGSSTTAGGLEGTLAWGKTTVLTPEQLVAELRSLQGRTNPLAGMMGGR